MENVRKVQIKSIKTVCWKQKDERAKKKRSSRRKDDKQSRVSTKCGIQLLAVIVYIYICRIVIGFFVQ